MRGNGMENEEKEKINKEIQLIECNDKQQQITSDNDDDEKMNKLEDRLEQAGIVKPPDGAFGWAVVFASFCTNGIVDGIIFTGE